MAIWLIQVINEVFRIYNYIILVRVLLSWVEPNPYNPIVKFIYKITEPVLRPFRIILRTGGIGFDISPILAFIALEILRRVIINFLLSIMQ